MLPDHEHLLLKVNEAAEMLGISSRRMYELVARGSLPDGLVVRLGRSLMISRPRLLAWLSVPETEGWPVPSRKRGEVLSQVDDQAAGLFDAAAAFFGLLTAEFDEWAIPRDERHQLARARRRYLHRKLDQALDAVNVIGARRERTVA